MKRDDITALFPDATAEQIDKLMALNGNDINKAKGDLENIKGQLATALSENEQLKNSTDAHELATAKQLAADLKKELDGMKATEALRVMREKVAADKKVPVNLLTGETEEDCASQADSILAFAKPTYPNVRDGGEVNVNTKASTRDQFADWAKENL